MKKVAIITCHDVYNHGASLQAYALSTYLRGQGCDVRIIDYKPYYLSGQYSLTAVNSPRWHHAPLRQLYLLLKLPGRLLRMRNKRRFDEFTARLPLTSTTYRSVEELRRNPPEADMYVAGSDQIWNPALPNGRDSAFYLSFGPSDTRRISYAASFSSGEIPSRLETSLHHHLRHMDDISVREHSGVDILGRLGYEGITVCDPVWLLPPEAWLELACGSQLTDLPERYLLAIDLEGAGAVESDALSKARSHHLPVISLGHKVKGSRHIADAGPMDFVRLISRAEAVVTNSYHGMSFACMFDVPLTVTMRTDMSNERILDFTTTTPEAREALIETSKEFIRKNLQAID